MERAALLKLGGFVAVLALVFAGAALAGSAIDPSIDEAGPAHSPDGAMDSAMAPHSPEKASADHEAEEHAEPALAEDLPGLAVAQNGFRLEPAATRAAPRRVTPFSFRILDSSGAAVTEFDETHERKLHLIVVRRDLGTFQHLHPRMSPNGTWRAPLDTSRPGTYRVFADFSAGGTPTTLGTDLFVPGPSTARRLPPVRNTVSTDGGYEVKLTRRGSNLNFVITKDGLRFNPRPYLGADGHLVALREHDLAFLHTHPEGKTGGTGPIEFETTFPSAGRYRLFFQFNTVGTIRTAPFTLNVTAEQAETAEESHDGGH